MNFDKNNLFFTFEVKLWQYNFNRSLMKMYSFCIVKSKKIQNFEIEYLKLLSDFTKQKQEGGVSVEKI